MHPLPSRVSIRDVRSRGDRPTSPSAFTERVSRTTSTGVAGNSGTGPSVSIGGTSPVTVVSRGLPSSYTTPEKAHMVEESGSSAVSVVWAVRRGAPPIRVFVAKQLRLQLSVCGAIRTDFDTGINR